jgi:phospholipid transport system substrate-binding protein
MLPHCRRAIAALALALFLTPALAAAPGIAAEDAGAFVAEFGSAAMRTMKNPRMAPADRLKTLTALVNADFDLPTIARFVLGRYWEEASESERAEFTRVFTGFMVETYAARFADNGSVSLRVIRQRAESETSTLVATEIARQTTLMPVAVDWRVAKTSDSYKITDISVSNVSLVMAQRDEFGAALFRNGGSLAVLTAQLREKVAAMAQARR